MVAQAIVRHEFVGPLLWSPRRHAYFMVRDDADAPATIALLRADEGGDDPHDPPENRHDRTCGGADGLAAELEVLGVGRDARHITSGYDDRLSAPLEVYFDFTWVCNLAKSKCGRDSFCYASDFLGKTTMPRDRVRALMRELAEWGVMRVHLAGGEPTTKKTDLANYLDCATSHGLYTSMATNGLLFDDEIIAILLRNSLKSVSFSLDGASEDTHAAVRGDGLFARTVAAVERTVAKRDAAGSDMRVCIKPTFTPHTPLAELERLVQLAVTLRADVIKFANPERCLHHDKGHYSRDIDAYYAAIDFVADLQTRYGGAIKITNINNPMAGCGDIGIKGLEGCIGGQELIAINPDGSVTPCLMHPYALGNIATEHRDLRDFWDRSERLPAFWAALKKPEDCKGCSVYGACRSGSTTRRIVEVGAFDARKTSGLFEGVADPLCPVRYLERHPGKTMTPQRPEPGALKRFKEIAVRHSL